MAIDQKVRFCYYLGAERVKIATKSEKQHHFSSWPMYIVYAQLGGVLEQRGLLHKAVALFVFCIVLRTKIKEPQP